MFTVENCKTRWQKIMDHYSREKLLKDKETRSGLLLQRDGHGHYFSEYNLYCKKIHINLASMIVNIVF